MSNLTIELKPTGNVRGDCTAPYDVELSRECTLRELVDVILTRNEWGYIGKDDPRDVFGYPRFEYSYDHIKEGSERGHFTEEDYNRIVKVVKADGGWSRMDYIVTLE
jgi:hypothetical protein